MSRGTRRLQLSVPLAYIETTIPPGMTIEEYRRSRPQRRRGWRKWLGFPIERIGLSLPSDRQPEAEPGTEEVARGPC
jgi:hypothetical protein